MTESLNVRDGDTVWPTEHVAAGQAGHVTATFHDQNGRTGRATQTLLEAAQPAQA